MASGLKITDSSVAPRTHSTCAAGKSQELPPGRVGMVRSSAGPDPKQTVSEVGTFPGSFLLVKHVLLPVWTSSQRFRST